MEDEIYVQSLAVKFVKENGSEHTVKFLGISAYTDEEFAKLIKEGKTLQDILAEDNAIMIGKPRPLNKVVTGDEYGDIVDIIRDELITQKPDV